MKWNKKFGAVMLATVILVLLLHSRGFPKQAAEASGLSWPSGQILPSFSAPASTLDVMNLVTEYRYDAEGKQVGHETGRLESNGWLAQTSIDAPNKYMVNGPYATDIPAGANQAYFDMIVDNNTANNDLIVTVDVRDNTTGEVLATRDITRQRMDEGGLLREIYAKLR